MLKNIAHIGLTVSDLETSIDFYQNTLGLTFVGQMEMEGTQTDILFNKEHASARVAYLTSSEELNGPSIELIQFIDQPIKHEKSNLFKTCISEICFLVHDIDKTYQKLLEKDVKFISQPQVFDSTKYGFGKSKAVYFYDPDGIILELIQNL